MGAVTNLSYKFRIFVALELRGLRYDPSYRNYTNAQLMFSQIRDGHIARCAGVLCSGMLCMSCATAFAEEGAPKFASGVQSLIDRPVTVYFWDEMSPAERAQLWPLLTPEQRLFHWRYMSKNERAQLRANMTHNERRAIKQRYVFSPANSARDTQRGEATGQNQTAKAEAPALPIRRLSEAERSLLRQQVIEVHVEIRRGVPYNCSDPTDCPKSAYRIRAAESELQGKGGAVVLPVP